MKKSNEHKIHEMLIIAKCNAAIKAGEERDKRLTELIAALKKKYGVA